MARYTYTYQSYPNCPEATEYSKNRSRNSSLLGMMGGVFVLFGVVWFLLSAFDFFETYDWQAFLEGVAFFFLAGAAYFHIVVTRTRNTQCQINIILINETNKDVPYHVVDAYCEEMRKHTRKENIAISIKFYLWFIMALVAAVALIGAIKGVYFLCHKQNGMVLMICSLIVLVLDGVLAWIRCRLHAPATKQMVQTPANNQSGQENCASGSIGFCPKCGAGALAGSLFCTKCGTKLG